MTIAGQVIYLPVGFIYYGVTLDYLAGSGKRGPTRIDVIKRGESKVVRNWKERVGFPEIASLSKKMEDRHANTGLLIATEGVTGSWDLFQDALGEIRNEFIRERRILVLLRSDLNRLVEGENLLNVLQEKLDELHFQHHKG